LIQKEKYIVLEVSDNFLFITCNAIQEKQSGMKRKKKQKENPSSEKIGKNSEGTNLITLVSDNLARK
jgi:hypothetical protein